jgi:hypothetical protein
MKFRIVLFSLVVHLIYREIISLGDENTANARCDSASAVSGALLLPSPLA